MLSPEAIIPSVSHLQNIQQNLINSLNLTLNGSPISGLSYLACNLNTTQLSTTSPTKLFAVIGGTNTEITYCDAQTKTLSNYIKTQTPTLNSSADLINLLQPHVSINTDITIIFTFPLQPIQTQNQLDGVLLRGTKQHILIDLIGKPIGKTLSKLLPYNLNITVINDITALLNPNQTHTLAGVVGTGSNFGIVHPISKEIINFEVGNFNDFELNDCLISIDKQSNNPSLQLWEKSISGAYLYQHYNYWAAKLNLKPIVNTTSLSQLTTTNSGLASILASTIIKSSAARVAVTIVALCDIQTTNDIVIEGSVFWKATNYQRYVQEYLDLLHHQPVTIIQAPSAMQNLISIYN